VEKKPFKKRVKKVSQAAGLEIPAAEAQRRRDRRTRSGRTTTTSRGRENLLTHHVRRVSQEQRAGVTR
jgi:hypothetical protein